MRDKKIRVLQILPSLASANGIASVVINYSENLPKNVETDFLILSKRDQGYFDRALKMGRIHENYISTNFIGYIIRAFRVIKNNNYDIVHCHAANYGALYLLIAKLLGVKVRVLHSHSSKEAESRIKLIRNRFLISIAKRCSNSYFACSEEAGRVFFGKSDFVIINNAINTDRFAFNKKDRNEIRKELKVDDKTILLGNIGRQCDVKNQGFLLRLIPKLEQCYRLLLIGNGVDFEKNKSYIEENGLVDRVTLLESRSDIEKLYSALDIFLLPSKCEGLPVVMVEAQYNGLKCIISDNVTDKTIITNNVIKLPLVQNKWIEAIKNEDRKRDSKCIVNDFDIKKQADGLYCKYEELLMRGK